MKLNTKLAFQESFRRLLLVKSLDKITVRDIVEDCGLTRNTFYYHYEDIYDLFDDYLDSQMRAVLTELPKDSPWDEVIFRVLNNLFETPRMGRHIFFSKKRDALQQYLGKIFTVVLERYIEENMQGLTVSSDDRRLVCDTCSHALYGLMEQWITGPEATLLQKHLRRVIACFEGSIRQALCYCAEHPREKENLL